MVTRSKLQVFKLKTAVLLNEGDRKCDNEDANIYISMFLYELMR